MEQKEIICRLLTALRETTDHSKRLHNHLARFDVDMDLFKDSPLEYDACDIVTAVIDDPHLVYWWIFGERNYYTPQDGRPGSSVFIETAEELWDYYFKNKSADEA